MGRPSSLLYRLIVLSISASLIIGLYLLRQENYALNKNVRLVGWRILNYEQISRHRKISYRMNFSDNRYTVWSRAAGSAGRWKEIASHPYENTLRPTLSGLEIVIENGAIISFLHEDSGSLLEFPLALGFFQPQNPARRKALLFQKDGSWKIQ
jgi:hypothetical protein